MHWFMYLIPLPNVSIEDRYDILREGFRHAARKYPQIIDTTKVGFMGHSFWRRCHV